MSYRLWPISALALVGVGLVNGIEICPQADLAGAHLCDNRADCFMCADMCFKKPFPWLDSKSIELSTMLGIFLGELLFVFHFPPDGEFRRCY